LLSRDEEERTEIRIEGDLERTREQKKGREGGVYNYMHYTYTAWGVTALYYIKLRNSKMEICMESTIYNTKTWCDETC
jgi:hypothetical protein